MSGDALSNMIIPYSVFSALFLMSSKYFWVATTAGGWTQDISDAKERKLCSSNNKKPAQSDEAWSFFL